MEPSAELKAVLNMNKAKDWNEFETALQDFHTPTQNFVFASNDGTIAYKANGNIPVRKKVMVVCLCQDGQMNMNGKGISRMINFKSNQSKTRVYFNCE